MNIYFVLAHERGFHPDFFEKIVKQLEDNHKIVGVSEVPGKRKLKFIKEVSRQYYFFGIYNLVRLGLKEILYLANVFLFWFTRKKPRRFYSLKSVCNYYCVDYQFVVNVNCVDHINFLRTKDIDVIVSSNGQIFKKTLLDVPKKGCINRHSALLPKYGGVWPIFWALLNGEKEVGVSVHYMVEKIDAGDILSQRRIPVEINDSLFSLYTKAFNESVPCVIEAIRLINDGCPPIIKFDKTKSSYFSFPKKVDCLNFRKKFRIL